MAPSKSRKRRRKRRGKQSRFERLEAKLQQGPFRDQELVIAPSGQVKMSAVLTDFVEPYVQYAETEEELRKLLTLAVMAWNASFLPEDKQQDMIESVLDAGIPEGEDELKAGLKQIMNTMIARKKAHFSEYTRDIIDFEVQDLGEDYHITVASTVKED